jgi:hypothetical protein
MISFPFLFHAFAVINEPVDAEGWRMLRAADGHFFVVNGLIHNAVYPDTIQPEKPPDIQRTAIRSGINPYLPVLLPAKINQLTRSLPQWFVSQESRKKNRVGFSTGNPYRHGISVSSRSKAMRMEDFGVG